MNRENTINRLFTSNTYLNLPAQTKASVILAIAIVIWGGNWPVMKMGLNHISPLWFSTLRFVLGAATLFCYQFVTKSYYLPCKKDIPLILSIGLIQMMMFTALGSIAMTNVDAGRSAVLAYTTTIWVLPLSVFFFREPFNRHRLIALFIGLIGVMILFNPFDFDWKNDTLLMANCLLLLAALGWSFCILHLRYSRSEATAIQLAPWQMLTATIPLVILSYCLEGKFSGDGSIQLWKISLYLGPLATAFCFCAVNSASRVLSGSVVSTAMLGVPVFGLMFSAFFLDEALTPSLLLGTFFICAGIGVVIRNNKRINNK